MTTNMFILLKDTVMLYIRKYGNTSELWSAVESEIGEAGIDMLHSLGYQPVKTISPRF